MWPGFLFFLLLLLRVHREPFPPSVPLPFGRRRNWGEGEEGGEGGGIS